MKRGTRRFIIGLVSLILIIAIVGGVVGLLVVRRPFPQTDGNLYLPGLQAPVDVYRDEYGVPHIFASNTHDLFMAQGFIHSQDRFWQMEFSRRAGSGTLSEVLGEAALSNDIFIRTVGWHRVAREEERLLSDDELGVIESYSTGVNAYLEGQDVYGLEFTVLSLTGVQYAPDPWIPYNSLTYAKLMAWNLGGNRDAELMRAQLVAELGEPALNFLVPGYSDEAPVIVETASNASLDSIPAAFTEFRPLGMGYGIGSNNWVISGDRTETGMPILANDPHLGIQMPSIWYEIGLHCEPVGPECPYNVVGASFPGVPGVIIGHNDSIAWGVTNLGPDVQDLFIERTNPDNPNQYLFNGMWRDMEIINEEIFIAGQEEPLVVQVRATHHGPIINDVVGGVESEWSFGWQPLAFSWTALQPSSLMQSVLQIDRAQNWTEFRQALTYWDVPSQNFVYADVEGNIGYQSPGRIPIRANGDGSIPVPGWTGDYEWVDYIPFNALPSTFNPEAGFILTANNAVVGPEYPYFLSMDWAPGYRATRIEQMLQADSSVSLDEVAEMQSDSLVVYAEDLIPYFSALEPEDIRLNDAIRLLENWDLNAQRDSAGAALFQVLQLELIDGIFADDMSTDLLERSRGRLLVILPKLCEEPYNLWWDDGETLDITEVRDEILLQALRDSVELLTETLGQDMSAWRWGDLHTATFVNQPLGQSGIAPIEALFNRGPVEVDGALSTVNNTGYPIGTSYDVSVVPSYRQILDLSDWNNSRSVHTTGQSGHPYHAHYDDMIDMWRNFIYHAMLWSRAEIEASATDHLRLTP
jgi:penicillin amidase